MPNSAHRIDYFFKNTGNTQRNIGQKIAQSYILTKYGPHCLVKAKHIIMGTKSVPAPEEALKNLVPTAQGIR